MHVHVFPVHKHYIKYSAVLLIVYDSAMVKHRKIGSVSFPKMKMNIVIFIAIINLLPDACFDLLSFIFPDQVAEASLCKPKKFFHIFISGHMEKLMVCIEKLILFFIRFVNNKCTRKVFRDILKCKSKLLANS